MWSGVTIVAAIQSRACYKSDALPRIKQASESDILQNKLPDHDDGHGEIDAWYSNVRQLTFAP